ncbi:hypothetical protein AX16_004917 [Volvariella volvacea WC 439]|nr:hypothetical protein AX16_004917 [Volvariella volvacea WC 439]
MLLRTTVWSLSFLTAATRAAVTVHGQVPLAEMTGSFTGPALPIQTNIALPAYNDTVLISPSPPDPPINTAFTLALQASSDAVENLSIRQRGDFLGFSIEMSVINQLMGRNSSHIQVPFLNLLGNIVQRAGQVRVRLGGNTQEFAGYVEEIDNWRAIAKASDVDPQNPTLTPSVVYTRDLFYLAANISSLVNVGWFLGIPFNDTENWRLEIAELGQQILGDHLLGLQAGNEPDLYARHHHRPETYTVWDYIGEMETLIQTIEANPNIPIKNNLIAPSIAWADWTPDMVWETGFLDRFNEHLSIITVERYPNNNCFFQFGLGRPVYAQEVFHTYLTHEGLQGLVAQYIPSSILAQQAGKPFMMFETNTASCGGYHGVSDSFGAALWGLDYGMQMAYANFSGALMHVGGQNVFYNPFTAPPTNTTRYNQWTVGAVYYSALVISEVFGPSNTSQIVDLMGNDGNPLTPQYAIYEHDRLARVALFNYIDDPSGANDYVATITVENGQVPSEVRVKYLLSDSVSTKNNITWAGQTLGTKFTVDGRLRGDLNIVTIACDQSANTCSVPVPAPGFALVFLTDAEVLSMDESTHTYATTAHTLTMNTATVDPAVLETSNGSSERERGALGSTSKGSVSGAQRTRGVLGQGVGVVVLGMAVGAWCVLRTVWGL